MIWLAVKFMWMLLAIKCDEVQSCCYQHTTLSAFTCCPCYCHCRQPARHNIIVRHQYYFNSCIFLIENKIYNKVIKFLTAVNNFYLHIRKYYWMYRYFLKILAFTIYFKITIIFLLKKINVTYFFLFKRFIMIFFYLYVCYSLYFFTLHLTFLHLIPFYVTKILVTFLTC